MAEALSGTPPDFPLFDGSIAEFVLSDPFEENSRWIKEGPPCNKGHFLKGKTPAQKPLLVNSQTGAQISSARLRKDVARLASGLRNKLKLQPAPYVAGPRTQSIVSPVVLIHLPNCIPFAIIELAIWQAGLTATTANSALKPAELAHIINLSKPAAVFTLAGADGVDVIKAALDHVEDKTLVQSYKTQQKIFSVDLAADDYGLTIQNQHGATSDWKTLLQGEDEKFGFPQYKPNSDENDRRAAVILWSSGTSGKSKGVILGHRAILTSVQSLFYGNPLFGPNEVFIGFAPFFHVFGLCNVYLLGIAMGATTVCMSKFEPKAFLQLAQDYKATHLHMAPPVAVILAKSPMLDGYDLTSVLGGTSGGAPLGVSIIEDVYKRLGFLIKMGYGLSETASTSLVPGNNWEEYSEYLNASGQPLPSVELKIIDVSGSGKTLKIGEAGEILIRSPSLMNGYLENPQATKEALDDDGWFHTGDVGKLDATGNLYIVDRLKEVIKVKGFQVAPAELEAYLNAHPEVADAGVTAIYSEDDATEYPKAYIVPKDTSLLESSGKLGKACPQTIAFVQNVMKHIEAKVIDYKWIRGGVVVCAAIPKSNSGKILRKDFKLVTGHDVQVYTAKKRAVRQSKL